MNGVELHNEILKLWPKAKILFISGHSRDIFKQNDIKIEDIKLMQKPFHIPDTSLLSFNY